MKISLNWIKDFVNLNGIAVEEMVKRFGLTTAEVEGVEYKGQDIENVVVAEILEVSNHPNSNHLHILKVNDGSGTPVQVVCGAPNVKVGLKTFFARVGANVCGVKIKPAKLAGVESFGMCCGGNELGINSDTSGIVEIEENVPVGVDIKKVLPIEDVIIEVDNKSLTNRPDLWGHFGMAREFAAMFKRELWSIIVDDFRYYKNLPDLNIKVETPNCFRYCGMSIKNVNRKQSSLLVQLRLNYCGMRDINFLADLTNYVMLETGQPMHAFDNNLVKGIKVIENTQPIKMITLEGDTHIIDSGSMVICDETSTPIAVAGVKGGLKSGITEDTNTVLIESACFDSTSIRKTSRKIGLITDASIRYEKSLDPELCELALGRLVYLMKQIEPTVVVSSNFTDVYTYRYPLYRIQIDANYVSKRGGVNLNNFQVTALLNTLGFDARLRDEKINVIVPSFRGTKDISTKEDLVEEVFRLYGYDKIPSQPMSMPLQPVEQLEIHNTEYAIKFALASAFNLNEVHSYVWNYTNYNKSVGIKQESVVSLMDSSKSGVSGLRASLAPTLLKMADENKNKYAEIGIFEIGRTFDELNDINLVNEKRKLSVVLASETKTNKDLYLKLKQIVEYIAKHICNTQVEYVFNNTNPNYHPINSCKIVNNKTEIGEMGIVYPSISKNIDKRKSFAMLELDIEKLLACPKTDFNLTAISKFQSVAVDYNFVADKTMLYSVLDNALKNFKSSHHLEHSLQDVYVNQQTLPDKISYTVRVIITPKNKTLETSDIEKFSNRLITEMKTLNIELRS